MNKLETKILCYIYRFKIDTVKSIERRFFYVPTLDIYRSLDNLYLNDLINYKENYDDKSKTIIYRTTHGSYAHSNIFIDKLDKYKERTIGFILGVISTLILKYLFK